MLTLAGAPFAVFDTVVLCSYLFPLLFKTVGHLYPSLKEIVNSLMAGVSLCVRAHARVCVYALFLIVPSP